MFAYFNAINFDKWVQSELLEEIDRALHPKNEELPLFVEISARSFEAIVSTDWLTIVKTMKEKFISELDGMGYARV